MTARIARDTSRTCSACGWTSRVTTPALADRALSIHSCDLYRRRQAMAERVQARRAADGPLRPCTHKIARHQHGTHAAYALDFCRCRPCRDAKALYEGRRQKEIAYGRWQAYVDARPARKHVRSLMAQGLGLKRISKLSGVSRGGLWKLVYGKRVGRKQVPSKRVRAETASALLAVVATPETLGATTAADQESVAVARHQLRELVATGWSMSRLARELGKTPANFIPVVTGDRPMRAETVLAVGALHQRLRRVAPPETNQRERIAASRARRFAADRGWLAPVVRPMPGRAPRLAPVLVEESTALYGWLEKAIKNRAVAS